MGEIGSERGEIKRVRERREEEEMVRMSESDEKERQGIKRK